MRFWKDSLVLVLFCFVLMQNIHALEPDNKIKLANEGSVDTEVCWRKFIDKANELYGGSNIDVTFSGGLETRKNVYGESTGPYADLKLSVPLYSKQELQGRSDQKNQYLKTAADLLKELDTNEKKVKILINQSKMLKQKISEDGIKGANEYFAVLEKIVELESTIKASTRKINALLN